MEDMDIQALKEPVDAVVHEPRRLAILAAVRNTPATFSELKEAVGLTDGNLDSHLRKLEDAGYVVKEVRSNPLLRRGRETVYKATEKGRSALDGYLDSMERRLEEAKVAAASGAPS